MKARLVESNRAHKDLHRAPVEVLRVYEVWARLIEEHGTRILFDFPGYHLEKLSGDWRGRCSIRLNRKWRVIFGVVPDGRVELVTVERVTAHDYRRVK